MVSDVWGKEDDELHILSHPDGKPLCQCPKLFMACAGHQSGVEWME
jgi:hypothetical protein